MHNSTHFAKLYSLLENVIRWEKSIHLKKMKCNFPQRKAMDSGSDTNVSNKYSYKNLEKCIFSTRQKNQKKQPLHLAYLSGN